MATRAVLFDLDGTLVDSLADIGESMNEVLAGRGLPVHDLERYRRFVGDGVAMLARRALGPGRDDEAAVAACVAGFRAVYSRRADLRTRPYAGVPALLDELGRRGLALAVLSNKPHDATVALVRSLLGRWSFAAVFGERAGIPRKPDPAAALEIARIVGAPASEFLYVGDTPTDVATAEAAGMPGVAVLWGFRGEDELRAAGAGAFASNPLEVLRFLR